MHDPRLFVWDVELDRIQTFDFSTGCNGEGTLNTNQSLEVAGRYPSLQYWDPHEPKLLVCQAIFSASKHDTEPSDSNDDKIMVCIKLSVKLSF